MFEVADENESLEVGDYIYNKTFKDGEIQFKCRFCKKMRQIIKNTIEKEGKDSEQGRKDKTNKISKMIYISDPMTSKTIQSSIFKHKMMGKIKQQEMNEIMIYIYSKQERNITQENVSKTGKLMDTEVWDNVFDRDSAILAIHLRQIFTLKEQIEDFNITHIINIDDQIINYDKWQDNINKILYLNNRMLTM